MNTYRQGWKENQPFQVDYIEIDRYQKEENPILSVMTLLLLLTACIMIGFL